MMPVPMASCSMIPVPIKTSPSAPAPSHEHRHHVGVRPGLTRCVVPVVVLLRLPQLRELLEGPFKTLDCFKKEQARREAEVRGWLGRACWWTDKCSRSLRALRCTSSGRVGVFGRWGALWNRPSMVSQ